MSCRHVFFSDTELGHVVSIDLALELNQVAFKLVTSFYKLVTSLSQAGPSNLIIPRTVSSLILKKKTFLPYLSRYLT